jgi:hypothetical protein
MKEMNKAYGQFPPVHKLQKYRTTPTMEESPRWVRVY